MRFVVRQLECGLQHATESLLPHFSFAWRNGCWRGSSCSVFAEDGWWSGFSFRKSISEAIVSLVKLLFHSQGDCSLSSFLYLEGSGLSLWMLDSRGWVNLLGELFVCSCTSAQHLKHRNWLVIVTNTFLTQLLHDAPLSLLLPPHCPAAQGQQKPLLALRKLHGTVIHTQTFHLLHASFSELNLLPDQAF